MKINWLTGLFMVLLCACASPTTEMEMVDAGTLVPNIQIKRIRDSYNQIYQTVEVQLSDTYNNSINESSVSVYFDGQSLQQQYNGSGILYYTLLGGISMFEPGSLHTIRITLNETQDYYCNVVIPATTLEKLLLPQSHKANTDLTVHWEGIDYAPKLLLWSGSNTSIHYDQQIQIPDDSQTKGQYTIAGGNFSEPDTYRFELISYNYGTVDYALGGGSITALWVVESECTITE